MIIVTAGSLADETFSLEEPDGEQFHFNVTTARRLVQERGEVRDFHLDFGLTAEQLKCQYVGLDEAHALTTDLTKPLLFVPFKGEAQLIDGFHRLLKALLTGVTVLPCYVLTEKEAAAALILRLPAGHGLDWGQKQRKGPQRAREEARGKEDSADAD